MKLALLSNVTVDLLAEMLKNTYDVYLSAGFDTWQQDMILPSSELYAYAPDAVVVLLHANAYDWGRGGGVIDDWCLALQAYCTSNPGIPVFVSSIDISNGRARYGAECRMDVLYENRLIECVQRMHSQGCRTYVLPVKDAICDMGRSAFYSTKMWYAGSMPYSLKGMSALTELIGRYCSVTKGMHKKCLAVDLDNTLWGGVIGEDGVEGIVLSDHKEGARYFDTQRILKKMKEQGVMLAVISKNNVEDVEPVFQHPHMVLKHEDFVAEAINWHPKTVNIRQLAKDLNIGLDSFVFLDDNPAEREQMKAECPEVSVIEFPKDSSRLPEVVESAYNEHFLSLEVTGEDARKTEMYRAESERKAEMLASASVGDFLKRLEMTMAIHLMKPEEEKRVVQLVNKTNQFNVTTKRYTEEEIRYLDKTGDIITVHMADKYGDQGLVAVLILRYDGMPGGQEAEIDTFLMSCRVMGRSAENEILARVRGYLEDKGVKTVKAVYVRTAKNAPVADLYEKLGFTEMDSSDEGGGGSRKEYMTPVQSLPEPTGFFQAVREEWT